MGTALMYLFGKHAGCCELCGRARVVDCIVRQPAHYSPLSDISRGIEPAREHTLWNCCWVAGIGCTWFNRLALAAFFLSYSVKGLITRALKGTFVKAFLERLERKQQES